MKRKHTSIHHRNASLLALLTITCGTGSALAVTNGTWNTNTSGNWSTGASWTGGTPNGIGDTANFGGGLSSGTKTWTFDIPVTLGVLNLDTNRTSNYNGTGANFLTFDNTGSTNAQLNVAALGNNNQSFGVEIRLMDSLDIVNNLPAGNKTLGINAISSYNGNLTITNSSVYHATVAATQFRSAISDGTGTISFVNAAGVASLQAANTFSGSTTVSGGILRLDNALSLQNSALNTSGSIAGNATNGLQINTGVTALTLGGLNGSKNFTQTGGVFTSNVANGNYNNITALTLNPGTGKSEIYSGNIDNGAAGMTLTKTGAGTQTLSGTNGYTGATAVNAGTLRINGSTSTSSAFTVGNTATLGGTGTVGGSVTVNSGGTLASGASIESLATGALTLNSGSTFAYEMNMDASAAAAGDLTAVTGNLTLDLGNLANLTLTELGAGSWTAGEKLTLISYSGTWNGGRFNYGGTLLDDSTFTFSGMSWLFNYNDTVAGSNFTGDLTTPNYVTMTAVPEPRAALLAGLGLLALLRRRRN